MSERGGMSVPELLPAQLYLLAYDPARGRLTARTQLGYLLRAAALSDLVLTGHLGDGDGRVQVRSAGYVPDPVLGAVLREIVDSKDRSWAAWVRRGERWILRAVRDQLAAGGWIAVEPYRRLGFLPATRVTVRDPQVVARLAATVTATLGGQGDEPRTAALAALAATGELRTVVTRAQAREYRSRIADLATRTGPPVAALRRVIREVQASAAVG